MKRIRNYGKDKETMERIKQLWKGSVNFGKDKETMVRIRKPWKG